ncbi:hypothetical protein PAESOLCIP111_00730 [Paenibacillus solanacearum]|uniref:DUF1292 domain-containing protein n=1 Tax=Paenibacillus solanacearum TaxID=2048548 RepID=A0A916NMD1_9BACL|nr:DUF1292 domain-containing protein [Paenibacillus solanacearum]CAG7604724.1 hypothetical protein PAESOLCIP111_00730 [Paenibacillus solanacearum]
MSDHIHDASCDHDHDEDIFIVTDENGVEHEMVMVYTFEVSEQAYAVLLDRNDMEADGVIFRIEEEDGEAMLASIEDEEEWNRVVQIYNEIVEEQEQ